MSEKRTPSLGCDRFTPDPGTHGDQLRCGVCGAVMPVTRNKIGPRGYVAAMAAKSRGEPSKDTWDLYVCPHREADWHQQAKSLITLARQTPSGRLAAQYLDEAKWIVAHKEANTVDFDSLPHLSSE